MVSKKISFKPHIFHHLTGLKAAFIDNWIELWTSPKTRGNIGRCCDLTGISYSTYLQWRSDDMDFQEAMQNAEVLLEHWVEGRLFEHIESADRQVSARTTMYYLDRRVQAYSPKQEISGPGGGPLIYQPIDRFVGPDPPDKDKSGDKGPKISEEKGESGSQGE